MAKRLQTYEGDGIIVTYDPNLCIHSGVCALVDPGVRSAAPAVGAAGERERGGSGRDDRPVPEHRPQVHAQVIDHGRVT